MKNFITILLIGLSFAIVGEANASSEPIDNIEATVSDSVITHSELHHAIDTLKKQMANSGMTIPPEADLHKQVLDQLINRKLQLQLAEQGGLSVTEEEIDATIKKIAAQNQISTTELYQKLTSQGMNKAEYRKELKEEITLQKLQGQEVASKISVSPQEVDDFMRSKAWQASNSKEYHLEDILIGLPDEPTSLQIAEAKKQAQTVLDKIHHGMNFQKAAMQASNNSSNALQGGDLGWRKLPEIPTIFTNHVLQMQQGDIAGPIQAQNGFHIIHLAGTRDTNQHHEAVSQRKQVEQLVFQRKVEEQLQNWILRLRSSTSINLYPEKEIA
jgi:peptidyl-prolyl cis-trans isomerase SurA